jgi:uncharacterized membrane protein
MSDKQLVLAFFGNEAAADAAVESLKQWDKDNKDVKLGAIGVMVKDEKGKIKTDKMGQRQTKLGAVLFAIAGILSGGLTVIGGAIFGGILGSFFHKGLGMSKEDLESIDGELDNGRAAVGVLVGTEDEGAVTDKLADLGGEPESYTVTEEALDHAEEEAEEAPEV